MKNAGLRPLRKLKLLLANMLRDSLVSKVSFWKAFFLAPRMKMIRVRYTAVKNEQMIPMIRVVAKPLMGPVPKKRRMTPVITEVRLESKMAEKALE